MLKAQQEHGPVLDLGVMMMMSCITWRGKKREVDAFWAPIQGGSGDRKRREKPEPREEKCR